MTRVQVLPRPLLLHLSLVGAISVAPYIAFQPWIISLVATVLIAWRAALAWRDAPAPPRWILLPIATAGMFITYLSLGRVLGKESGLAVLCLLLPLKLLETQDSRDARAALLLACFLLVGQFLHKQNAWTALSVAIGSVAVLGALARLHRPDLAPLASTRIGLRLMAQGVPLMLLLFLLFPRVDGPLWGLPMDAYGGMTGLSDRMAPGSISQLVPSGEIAFRARFQGDLPPPQERYWRGPVLSLFDGREWRMRLVFNAEQRPSYDATGRSYPYLLTLEPHNQRWLLALDYPGPTDAGRLNREFSLLAAQPVRGRQRHMLTAYPEARLGIEEDARTLQVSLQLPPGSNPRSVALGRRIGADTPAPHQRLARILASMRSANLLYTLYPPLAGQHPADEFLFDSKRGFCEHFAGSFVVLARAAGLPARVVTGYQGGELNPVDGTLVVRQSDAHAWAEVWLEGSGWTRVDPTAASFPRRVDGGLTQALPANEALPFALRENFEWLRGLRYRWEALGNAWNQWVLGYNAARQMELLRNVGMPDADWRTLIALLGGLGGAWMAWLAWRMWPRSAARDDLDRAWAVLCKRLARRGYPRHPWETPGDYATRIALQDAELGRQIQALAERYARMRYGRLGGNRDSVTELRKAIARI